MVRSQRWPHALPHVHYVHDLTSIFDVVLLRVINKYELVINNLLFVFYLLIWHNQLRWTITEKHIKNTD